MNQNKLLLLLLLVSNTVLPMEHARRMQESTTEQASDKNNQKVKSFVQDYVSYNKSHDKNQIDETTKERIKKEYEKSKGNQLTQVINKLRQPHEGLLGTTAVKTQNGYRKIAELKVGDTICCYDFTNQKETISKVTYADKVHLKKHIQIVVNDQTIHVSPSHKFYIQSLNMWVTATDIKNNLNLRQLVDPNIKDIKEVKEALDVVRITVDEKQNYFITDHNILVHNFAIEVAILWGAGAAEVTWAIVAPTLAALGIIATKKIIDQNRPQSSYNPPHHKGFDYNNHQHAIPIFQQQAPMLEKNNDKQTPPTPKLNNNGGGDQQDPNKNKDDKEKNSTILKLIEESKPGEKTRGGKSTQFEKPGTYEDAVKDFDKLKPNNVKDISNGKTGTLPDGRPVNVRHTSTDKRPTLEIQNDKYDYLKFRYGFK